MSVCWAEATSDSGVATADEALIIMRDDPEARSFSCC